MTFLVLAILISLSMTGISYLDFEKDFRWFERFPHAKANPEEIIYQDMNMRDEWQFFHSDETDEEIKLQRSILTKGNLLPDYGFLSINTKSIFDEFSDANETLAFVDVWKYIYG